MDIYICTYGRHNNQVTWNQLPRDIQDRTKLVVQYREFEKYTNYPILILPDEIRTLPDTREYLKNLESGHNKCVQLDDDLLFYTRRKDEPTKFQQATPDDMEALFYDIEMNLNKYAHVGVSGREGANRNVEDYLYVTRQMRVHGYNRKVLREWNVKHNRLQDVEDFDTTLQLLRAGFPNCVINYMVHNQSGGSAAPGGCSTYRTLETHDRDVRRLAELHPEYVTVVTKQTKTAWGGKERTDVRIKWKRAYNESAFARPLDQ